MGKIYQGQTDLTIALTTEKDITGATETKIKFSKPNGVTGEWTATITNPTEGIIEYDVDADDIDVVGKYTIWAKITDSQGLVSYGEPSIFNVNKEGS